MSDDDLPAKEIQRRMENGIRRALNTLPRPTKELLEKGKLEAAMRESRVGKSARLKQKAR